MAIYRNVHTSFWEDAKVSDEMTPEDKYFMLYLLTNPHSTQLGCYSITKKQIAYEMGYNVETIEKLLIRMENNLKVIKYDDTTKEILILNWHKYNWTLSPKLQSYIKKELTNVKSAEFKQILKNLIEYIYGIDTVGIQEEKEEEQEKEKKQEEEQIKEERFNIFWNKYPKKASKANAKKAFFKANFNDVVFSEMLNSIEKFKKTKEWKKDKGQFIPYPATWLNQRRWEDEFAAEEEVTSAAIEIDPEIEKRFMERMGGNYGRN